MSCVHGVDRIGAPASILMMGWLSVVLWLDSDGTLSLQRALGVGTWLVLAFALRRVRVVVRLQTAVVVAFATLVEYIFSPTLEVYLYRFDNVPTYVPPGHGLVYLSAFALGHTRFVQEHLRACMTVALVAGGAWAGYGMFLAERPDALGAFWYVCLVGFMAWGPSKGVYVGAFVVVSYLEVVGTELGTWVWQTHDPTGWVSIGNPPSGAAGGYGWFDLAGLVAAPYLVRLFSRDPLQDPPKEPLPARPADVH
jgi:hypothetical protein